MATLFQPFIDLWQRITLGQRAALVLGLGLIIAVVAGAVSYTTRPVYTTLYTGVSSKDAAQIADELRDQKIPFEVSSDGSTIEVPQQYVNKLRLELAGKGLPASGEIGYELFDKPMLGMTDFMQRMNYHRALEGELARTIAEIEGVEGARVHLVVPEQKLFREDKKPPTASIIVQLRPDVTLTHLQVQGVANLTAFSVEGLEVENITIVDSHGNLLTNGASRNDLAGLSNTQLEARHNIETDLERKALTMLEDVLGPGKARAKVTVELNWDRIERTVENYDAERSAVLSEELQESQGGAQAEGSRTERIVTNYQVPRTVETYVPEVGNIERISASVLVDGSYVENTDAEGAETRTFVERTPQELEKYRTLVAAAIGIDPGRNDELTVISLPLSVEEEEIPLETGGSPNGILLKIIEKAVLLGILVGLFFLVRTLIVRLSDRLPALPGRAGPQAALAGAGGQAALTSGVSFPGTPAEAAESAAQAAQSVMRAAAENAEAASESGGTQVIFKDRAPTTVVMEEEAPDIEVLKQKEILRRTTQYIVEKPENATQVLRSWVLEEASKKYGR